MEQQSLQSIWTLLLVLAALVTATTALNVWFVITAHRLNKELHGFFADLQDQVRSYLGTHQLWSDVTHQVISSGPAILEAGIRLTSSLQQLTQYVDRAGGIGRVFETAAKARTKKEPSTKPTTRETVPKEQ